MSDDRIGRVLKCGFDDKGYERRERLEALVECPKCGKAVGCWSDTEEWTKGKDGRWHHAFYSGVATGECCGLALIADGLSGECFAIGDESDE